MYLLRRPLRCGPLSRLPFRPWVWQEGDRKLAVITPSLAGRWAVPTTGSKRLSANRSPGTSPLGGASPLETPSRTTISRSVVGTVRLNLAHAKMKAARQGGQQMGGRGREGRCSKGAARSMLCIALRQEWVLAPWQMIPAGQMIRASSAGCILWPALRVLNSLCSLVPTHMERTGELRHTRDSDRENATASDVGIRHP